MFKRACEGKQKLFPLPDSDRAGDGSSSLLRDFLRTFASRVAADSNVSWHNVLMLREIISPSEGVVEILQLPFRQDLERLQRQVGDLLGDELDVPELRHELTTQIVARIMFLRTGKNLRRMVGLDSAGNEDPAAYADTVFASVLLQIDGLRQRHGLQADNNSERG